MTLTSLFTTAFLVAFSGAMMPGPLLTVNINESLRRGFIAGPLIILGHAILELALLLGMAWGLNEILGIPQVKGVIALIGGVFLIWMGCGILKDAHKVEINFSHNNKSSGKMGPVMAGALLSISNPYWIIWWATLGLSYVTTALEQGAVGLSVFFFGHILADLVWFSLISYLVAVGRKFINISIYREILKVCGIFLICLALYFLYSGVNFF